MTGFCVVSIIVCLCMAVISYIKERDIFNPLFLFSLLWFLITFLAGKRFFSAIEASALTYNLVTIGIISFGVGCFLARKYRFTINSNNGKYYLKNSNSQYYIDYKLLRVFAIIAVVLFAFPALNSFTKISSNMITLSHVRSNVTFYNNGILNLICNYIIKPFNFALLPICAIDFFFSKKRDKILLITSIIIVIENVLIDGGRFIILFFLINFAMANLFSKKKVKLKFRTKIAILVGLVIALFAIYNVSLMRGIDDVGRSFYFYFTGCIPHLSERLKEINQHGHFTYGMASLHGFMEFGFTMLENIGFSIPQFYIHASQLMYVEDLRVITSTGNTINAFVTPFFYLYLDGRILGVILGMILYGAVCYKKYKSVKKYFNIKDFAIYLLLTQGILTSFVRMQFYDMYYVLGFLFIYIIIRKEK